MNKGTIQVIYGDGAGKTSAAIGKGIGAVARHRSVIMVQFLKGSWIPDEEAVLKRLEPEMRIFRFEKTAAFFDTLSEEEKAEELMNIRNGLNYAKKVMCTGECDMLVLDELLGLLDQNIISLEEFQKLLDAKPEFMDLIITGKVFPDELYPYVDVISKMENVKVDNSIQR